MKTRSMKINTLFAALSLLSSFILHPSPLFAQGTLTPPGAPAPTMKSLAQIEPRTPISSVPFTISAPGSYYLTTNVTATVSNAIIIASSDVSLDLNGFTVFSTTPVATGTAILLGPNIRNITIQNGFIHGGVTNNGSGGYSGPGFRNGINISTGIIAENVQISRLSIVGCMENGINITAATTTVIESCTVRTIGALGICAMTVRSCVVRDCGGSAISCSQASDCRGESDSGSGVSALTAINCTGSSDSGNGISAATAQNCRGTSNTGNGVSATTAMNCYGFSNSGTGLKATVASFCVGNQLGGTAINATVATGCYAFAGTNIITHKYNMP